MDNAPKGISLQKHTYAENADVFFGLFLKGPSGSLVTLVVNISTELKCLNVNK